MGVFQHACEGDLVCRSTNDKIPYFNAPIYLQNKESIGKVEEILGPINEVVRCRARVSHPLHARTRSYPRCGGGWDRQYFTVKPQAGMVATSFKQGDKVYIAGDKLLPLARFLPQPKLPKGACVCVCVCVHAPPR
jgi:H/ACA ribonucleoprotein complex subunit 1